MKPVDICSPSVIIVFEISPWSRFINFGHSNSSILLVISFLIFLSSFDLQITKYLFDMKKIKDEIMEKIKKTNNSIAKLISPLFMLSLIFRYSKSLIISERKYIAIVSVIAPNIPANIAMNDSFFVLFIKLK